MNQTFSLNASKISLAVVFTALALMLSSTVDGDEFDRIDNTAQKIQKKSRLLIKETVHYRHTPQYRLLVDATTHLYDAASHVHEVAHFSHNLNYLQTDLAELDQYFDQLEGLFQASEDWASRGHGEVHGSTGYAKRLMRSIESYIDSMRKDVRKAQSKIASEDRDVYRVQPPVTRLNRYDSPGSHHDSNGNNHRHDQKVAPLRAAKPVVIQSAVPQYRSVYQPPRHASGFNLSIGGGRLNFNF